MPQYTPPKAETYFLVDHKPLGTFIVVVEHWDHQDPWVHAREAFGYRASYTKLTKEEAFALRREHPIETLAVRN